MANSSGLILYAEDEEDDAFILQRAFRRAAIRNPLVIMPNGKMAMEYLSGTGLYADRGRHPVPCLVLLDLNMPGKSGLDLLKWIRAKPSTCTLVVLVITSSSQHADIHRAYLLGANGYLVKPGNQQELVTMAKAIKDYWLAHNWAAT